MHCFYLKIVNQVLYGQNHCLLLTKNSHNQSQQVKARTAQKSSNLAGNCRWQAGYFQVNTGKVQPLQIPVPHWFCTAFRLILYCKCLTLGHTKISYFLAFLTTSELTYTNSLWRYTKYRIKVEEIQYGEQTSSTNSGNCWGTRASTRTGYSDRKSFVN